MLTEDEHRRLTETINDLDANPPLLIGVQRDIARRLFTEANTKKVFEQTGESIAGRKMTIQAIWLCAYITMLASTIAIGVAYLWWAFLIIPIIAIWFLANQSMSVTGNAGIGLLSCFLVGCIIPSFLSLYKTNAEMIAWIGFAFSLWLMRLAYITATQMMRNFVLSNYRAWNTLENAITVVGTNDLRAK